VYSGELAFCPSCKKNKPSKDFLDSSLISGVGRNCMDCKGKASNRENRKQKTASKATKRLGTSKFCRVCARHLVEGENWGLSRVKRHDYICSSCKGKKKTTGTVKKISLQSTSSQPNCPKCGTKLVKRYSSKYSKNFWGCPRYPACRGGRNI
jgi:hypothetical protein